MNLAFLKNHIYEIKKRLIIWLGIWSVCSFCIYFFKDNILIFILEPLNEILIMTHITEGFMITIKLIVMGGFILSMPFALYQAFKFIRPGLYKNERRFWIFMMILSMILFLSGVIFAHLLILPLALSFLKAFGGDNIGTKFLPSLTSYLEFYINLIFAFGLSFEFPIILLLLGKMNILSVNQLLKGRRIAIVLIFTFSAIITPPDVLSQISLAIPLIGFYEISIILLKSIQKNRV